MTGYALGLMAGRIPPNDGLTKELLAIEINRKKEGLLDPFLGIWGSSDHQQFQKIRRNDNLLFGG
jgi:hypothetical protein